jgi:peptidoglycan hydrolase-like protein with peptidoglycan-binding domain
MGDEQDSWFKPFGFDPAKFAADTLNTAEKTVATAVQDVKAVVQKVDNVVSSGITTVVKTVANAVTPSGGPSASGSGSGGSASSISSLGGSVGQGGQNNAADVKAVQAALNSIAGAGLAVDGKCGGGTVNAIVAFQKSLGQARPDGRIDPGATARLWRWRRRPARR